MLTDLLTGSAPAPGLRRPVFEIGFGGGAGDAGLGGLLGTATAAVGLPGAAGADPWQQSLIGLSVTRGLAPAVDVAEILLAAGLSAPAAAIGDAGSIKLGYADAAAELVFTGHLAGVRHDATGATRLTACNGGAKLARCRINQSYAQLKAGGIVRELAGAAEVETGTVVDGVELPFYVVDDRRSALVHVAALAERSGCLAFVDEGGRLVFTEAGGSEPATTFTFAEDILALTASEQGPALKSATVLGEGAAGSQGRDAWGWLIKDPSAVTGQAGQGAPARSSADAALRSAEAVRTAANARIALADRATVVGRLLVPGAPTLAPGDVIAVAAAPRDALNRRFVVTALRHRYSAQVGYTTELRLAKSGAGAAGAGLGGLL